jgi:hypothetical protein
LNIISAPKEKRYVADKPTTEITDLRKTISIKIEKQKEQERIDLIKKKEEEPRSLVSQKFLNEIKTKEYIFNSKGETIFLNQSKQKPTYANTIILTKPKVLDQCEVIDGKDTREEIKQINDIISEVRALPEINAQNWMDKGRKNYYTEDTQ